VPPVPRKKWSWTTFFKGAGGVIAALGTLVTILISLGIVGDSGGGNSIADAAQATTDAGSSRLRATAMAENAGLEVAVSGEGILNFRTGEGEFTQTETLDLPPGSGGPARGTMTIREIFTTSACYTRLPANALEALAKFQAIAAGEARTLSPDEKATLRLLVSHYGVSIKKLDPEKAWVMTEQLPPPPSSDPGTEFSELLGGEGLNDPSRMVALFESSANLEKIGDETLFGVPTTHYKGTLDLRDLPATLPELDQDEGRAAVRSIIDQTGLTAIPVEIWIDDGDLVRRLILGMPIAAGLTVPVTVDFFDFGVPVRVKPPPPGQVVHLTAPGQCLPGVL